MRVATRRLLQAAAVATGVGAAAVAVPLLAEPESVSVQVAANGTPVPGQYIVTLKPGASTSAESGRIGAADVKRFDGVLNAFSARLTAGQLAALRKNGRVAAIEQDQIVKTSTVQRSPLPWNLDRIDQRSLPLSKSYSYRRDGRGVTAYVIDTGIAAGHPQFGKRARSVWSAPRFKGDGRDHNGHGTHVAGIIGAAHHGVAKGVQLRSLRVLDEYGSGSMSDVIAAARWLRLNAARPSVANLSLTGNRSKAANDAIAALSRSGVFVTTAAGNDGDDACRYSPAGAPLAFTVGATDSADRRAGWSNVGKCVELHAPGKGIRSTWLGGGSRVADGTSMAAPHAAGTAALFLSHRPKVGFLELQKWLIDTSTKGKVRGLPAGARNRLLYKGGL
ncbi:S8 family peptidase [Thermomonospora umbrina]|uniref:Subtilisin family serine protease n=1 Tax=Thermomonospora umbrina TaxID=111806 RepID=A0A3D9SLX8_9ACTN|nr:S8 family peptidase [Thermomonospora umbrina]REE96936.1 subtilisin family serine protease [Thermomonospora umbrina]